MLRHQNKLAIIKELVYSKYMGYVTYLMSFIKTINQTLVACFILGVLPESEVYMPKFRNTVYVPHS
jgi:hypothetical protein